MHLETKYLRLRAPVEFGTRFGDWQVCWLGGWARSELYYLVMLVKVPLSAFPIGCDEATASGAQVSVPTRAIDLAFGVGRVINGVAMNTFTIDTSNTVTAFASLDEARAAKIHNAEYFGSSEELAKLVASWPRHRPVEIWNGRRCRRAGWFLKCVMVTEIRRFQVRHFARTAGLTPQIVPKRVFGALAG